MAIKIQAEETVIPVEIGKLTFEFNISDEAIISFRKGVDKVSENLTELEKEINEENEEENVALLKKVFTEGFDFILGKGAFEKLYKQTPSVFKLKKVLTQLIADLTEELKEEGFEESQKELGQKYLAKKAK